MILRRNEKGFTLLELLAVIGISGIITGVMSMTIIMMMKVSAQSNDYAVALQQVQNAGYWITRDVMMAQTVTPEPSPGVLLTIELDESDGSTTTVDYIFEGDNKLKRQVNGSSSILIAQYILQDWTTFEQDDEIDSGYKLIIRSSSGEVEVEKSYVVSQRAPASE